jgi:hypothetical protein
MNTPNMFDTSRITLAQARRHVKNAERVGRRPLALYVAVIDRHEALKAAADERDKRLEESSLWARNQRRDHRATAGAFGNA